MPAFRAKIGERIRQVRGEYTQREFADLLGFSQGFVGDIERGRSFPSISFVVALNAIFGVDLNWLLTGESMPPIPSPAAPSSARSRGGTAEPGPGAAKHPGGTTDLRAERDFAKTLADLWKLFQVAGSGAKAWMHIEMQRALWDAEAVVGSCHEAESATDETASDAEIRRSPKGSNGA